jgi:hypothetical protein
MRERRLQQQRSHQLCERHLAEQGHVRRALGVSKVLHTITFSTKLPATMYVVQAQKAVLLLAGPTVAPRVTRGPA